MYNNKNVIHGFAAYFHRLRIYGLKDISSIHCSALQQ